MRYAREFLVNALVGGVLVVLPIYLSVLLLFKGMQAVAGLVKPFAMLLPEWLPAENVLSLLLVLFACGLHPLSWTKCVRVPVRTPDP